MALNLCQFIGNVVADPEIRTVQGNTTVANFRIAINERWRDRQSGERRERSEYIPIVCFVEGLCGVIENYVRKGTKVYVSGKMQTRSWEKDGQQRYTTEVILEKLDLLSSRSDDSPPQDRTRATGKGQTSGYKSQRQASPDIDDDMPF